MSETPEQFAARPIWEPYEAIIATPENIDALRIEFQLDRIRIGETCFRRKTEYYYQNTSDIHSWCDKDGVRWVAYGDYRRRM